MHILDSSAAHDCRDMADPTMVSNENETYIEPIMGGKLFLYLKYFFVVKKGMTI